MTEEPRTIRWTALFGIVLVFASIAGTFYWIEETTVAGVPVPEPEFGIHCSGRVDVHGRVIALLPELPGRVTAVYVAEGDTVEAGQALVQLDATQAQTQLQQATIAVDVATITHVQAEAEAQRLPERIKRGELLVEAHHARVETAEKTLQLRRKQASIAPLSQTETLMLEAKIKELELLETSQRMELDELRRSDVQSGVRLAASRLKAAEADLALAQTAMNRCTIIAPTAGRILRLSCAVGEQLIPSSFSPALVFAPDEPLIIRAEVAQEHLSSLRVGMTVEFDDENATTSTPWTGTIASISPWVAQRRTFILEPGEINDIRTVECTITIDNPDAPLWIGQRVRIHILD